MDPLAYEKKRTMVVFLVVIVLMVVIIIGKYLLTHLQIHSQVETIILLFILFVSPIYSAFRSTVAPPTIASLHGFFLLGGFDLPGYMTELIFELLLIIFFWALISVMVVIFFLMFDGYRSRHPSGNTPSKLRKKGKKSRRK